MNKYIERDLKRHGVRGAFFLMGCSQPIIRPHETHFQTALTFQEVTKALFSKIKC